jgi:hypothetical protein
VTDPIDQARTVIEDAIRDYIAADEDAHIVTDWLVVAATFVPGEEGANGYWLIRPPSQAVHVTLGLVESARHDLLSNSLFSTMVASAGDDE